MALYIKTSPFKKLIKSKLDESYKLYDRDKRFKKLAEIEQLIFESYTIMPLYEEVNYYLLRPGFKLLNEPLMTSTNVTKDGCDQPYKK